MLLSMLAKKRKVTRPIMLDVKERKITRMILLDKKEEER